MPHIIEITDLSAPELAPYTRLTEAQLRNKLEPEKGIFIAESPKVIGTALDAGCEPLSFLMERRQIDGPAAGVLARCPDAAVYTADRSVLQALTGYALTRGVLCAMRRPQPRSVEALCRDARRVAVLEGIVDSTNIGAIFRGAAALGMDAVLLSPSCCDPLCRRAVRVSMGTVFQVPWATLGDSPADWPEAGMARLHALGFKTAAMALDSRAVSIDDPTLRAEPRLAIVKNKAALLGMELPDKISAYIAENVTANVRQLEGTINKILAYKDLLGNDTDEETVTRAIQDMLRRSNEYVPTPEAILEYISKYYSLDESVIRGQQRVRDAVSARQIAMYLIRSMTNLSLDEIGKVFDNRDHSTVLISIQQIEKKMKKDAAFAEMVKEIKTNINSKR